MRSTKRIPRLPVPGRVSKRVWPGMCVCREDAVLGCMELGGPHGQRLWSFGSMGKPGPEGVCFGMESTSLAK